MGVRAKFFVSKKTEHANSGIEVTLSPVCRGEENKEWSKYTPSGEIRMSILNDSASSQFKVGVEYYVDFSEAFEEVL